MGRTDYLIIHFGYFKFVKNNVEDLRCYHVDNCWPIFYVYEKKCVSLRLFFVQFHTLAPVWTKFGMMAEELQGEVLDSWK
jgi:hypothetical protein